MNPSSTECEGSSNRHYTSEIDDNFSELTKTTISKIKRRYRTNRSDNEEVKSKFYDTNSPSYGWLLPGWVGEERLMIKTRRVYKYYYDPQGQQYKSRSEVTAILEKAGMILID